MTRARVKAKSSNERGMALLLTLFALLLLSGIGLFMVLSSDTETRIDANYGSSLRTYYAARSGLEEIRDRVSYASPATPGGQLGGLADLLPQDVAGNAGGVLYVVNPANGETVDPTDLTSPYFDDDLCHAFNSGTPKGIKCTAVPPTAGWQLASQQSQTPQNGAPLSYKWIRINMKTNRTASPYFVDQGPAAAALLTAGGSGDPLDTPVCWDGATEQLLPSNGNPSCDANGMQTVYMLTSLAVSSQSSGVNGARKLLQAEVVPPSIRPAGALTAASMNLSLATNAGIPPVAVDGRVHKIDGTLSTNPDGSLATINGCSSIAPLATNTGSSQMEQTLNQIRKSIVDKANTSCNPDGSPQGSNSCPAGLWWVRGTNLATRFVTSVTSGGSGSSPGGSGSDGGHDGHDGHHSPTGVTNTACDPSSPSCFTNLDLAAPELFAISAVAGTDVPTVTLDPSHLVAPFVANSGNQVDATIYQPALNQTVPNQMTAVSNLVAASQSKGNYFTATSTTLNSSYGSQNNPVVLEYNDPAQPTLSLQNSLTGFGVLVIPSALEINAPLNWKGIVMVQSPTGHVTVMPNASGSINGALLMAPGAVFNFSNSSSSTAAFQITYSCESIDLPFKKMMPFKVVSTSETSF